MLCWDNKVKQFVCVHSEDRTEDINDDISESINIRGGAAEGFSVSPRAGDVCHAYL